MVYVAGIVGGIGVGGGGGGCGGGGWGLNFLRAKSLYYLIITAIVTL